MNRIARVRHQHDIARCSDGLGNVGETFLGAKCSDDLRFGIEFHAEAPVVVGRLRAAQPWNSARRGIAVGARLAEGVLELFNDMSRCRQIGIAHAEIDDVRSRVAGLRLGLIHLFEHVRRQAANAVKVFHRSNLQKSSFLLTAVSSLQLPPAGFYHGFALLPAACPLSPSSGGVFVAGPAFLPGCGRPSWRSRTAASSFSSRICSSSVMVTEVRVGGMSWTAGYA